MHGILRTAWRGLADGWLSGVWAAVAAGALSFALLGRGWPYGLLAASAVAYLHVLATAALSSRERAATAAWQALGRTTPLLLLTWTSLSHVAQAIVRGPETVSLLLGLASGTAQTSASHALAGHPTTTSRPSTCASSTGATEGRG